MAQAILDQQLEWNTFKGFCQLWNANAQLIRPDFDYTSQNVAVLLSQSEITRRGPGVILLEQVANVSEPGTKLFEASWHSDELGPPEQPNWIVRGFPERTFKKGVLYRIVVHTMPGWEFLQEDGITWKKQESLAAILWAAQSPGNLYPRGYAQSGYNFQSNKGSWVSDKGMDLCFRIGADAIKQFALNVVVWPQGSGTVTKKPNKGVYEYNEKVTLTAIPNKGSKFVKWSGSIDSTDTTASIIMDSPKSVMANFSEDAIPDVPIIDDIIEWVKAQFEALYAWLQGQFNWMIEQMEPVVRSIVETLLSPINTLLYQLEEKVTEVWDWVTESIPSLLAAIGETVGDLVEGIIDKISPLLERVTDQGKEMWDWLTEKIPEIIRLLGDKVDEVLNWIKEAIPGALEWLKQEVLDIGTFLKDLAEGAIAAITAILDDLWAFILEIKDQVTLFFQDPLSWVMDNILGPIATSFNAGLERALQEETVGAK